VRGSRQLQQPHYVQGHLHIDWDNALPSYAEQYRFVTSEAGYNYFLGGVGTGKTVGLCDRNIRKALGGKARLTHAVFARTGRDLRDVILDTYFQRLEVFERRTGIRPYLAWRRSDMAIKWINQSWTIFRPYDNPDKLRGLNLGSGQVDEIEFSMCDPVYAMEVLTERVRKGPAKDRSLDFSSSPNGLRGVVKVFREAQRAGNRDFASFHATMYQNPFIFDRDRCEECDDDPVAKYGCPRCRGMGLESRTIQRMRSVMSERQWRQEGEGEVLLPLSAVFGDSFSEALHVIDWTWDRSNGLPWVLCVDWGEAHAYFAAVQILPRPMQLWDGRVIPAGSWVVAAERKMQLVSRNDVRRAIIEFINDGNLGGGRQLPGGSPGLPSWAGADRAVPQENQWLRREFRGLDSRVGTCDSRQEQQVKHGVGMLDFMLAPNEGPPRLYFAKSLLPPGGSVCGARGAFAGYSYVMNRWTNQPTEVFNKDDIHDHPVDAIRYGVVTTARRADFHGGERLPYLSRHTQWADAA
jgi:hypothetical protein